MEPFVKNYLHSYKPNFFEEIGFIKILTDSYSEEWYFLPQVKVPDNQVYNVTPCFHFLILQI